jgi:Zn-dependent peptidase ImmA (M78 family)
MIDNVIARRRAQKVLKDSIYLSPREMDIVDFAATFDVQVENRVLDGTSAMLFQDGERAIVTVNKSLLYYTGRYRFAVAHELGHFFLHRDLRPAFQCTEEMFLAWYRQVGAETEANAFAAELLMPEDDFRNRIRGQNPTVSLIHQEAEYFGTSLTSTCVRLAELAEYKLVMYVVTDGRVKWFRASVAVSLADILPNGTRVSDDTLAGNYFLTQDTDELSATMPSHLWLSDTINWSEEVCESSLYLTSMNTVISLIWEP